MKHILALSTPPILATPSDCVFLLHFPLVLVLPHHLHHVHVGERPQGQVPDARLDALLGRQHHGLLHPRPLDELAEAAKLQRVGQEVSDSRDLSLSNESLNEGQNWPKRMINFRGLT